MTRLCRRFVCINLWIISRSSRGVVKASRLFFSVKKISPFPKSEFSKRKVNALTVNRLIISHSTPECNRKIQKNHIFFKDKHGFYVKPCKSVVFRNRVCIFCLRRRGFESIPQSRDPAPPIAHCRTQRRLICGRDFCKLSPCPRSPQGKNRAYTAP